MGPSASHRSLDTRRCAHGVRAPIQWGSELQTGGGTPPSILPGCPFTTGVRTPCTLNHHGMPVYLNGRERQTCSKRKIWGEQR